MTRKVWSMAAALVLLSMTMISSQAQKVKVPGAKVEGSHGTVVGPKGAARGTVVDAQVPRGGTTVGHATGAKAPVIPPMIPKIRIPRTRI